MKRTRQKPAGVDAAAEDPGPKAWAGLLEASAAVEEENQRVCRDLEVTTIQAWTLKYLDPERPCSMSTLAAAYACDASNITAVVDKLEARGLVERRASDSDRRMKMLVVTAVGARLRRKLIERWHAPPLWIRALAAEDQERLGAILERALEHHAAAEPADACREPGKRG
jgi:DNA-binding MarR family transcriptional regulator